MTARIALVVTGGTIASTSRGDGPSSAALSGGQLLEGLPARRGGPSIEVVEISRVNGWNMTPHDMSAVADAARRAIDSGVEGVVVTHGTDALEETALVVDLYCRHLTRTAPIVFTGAMRSADAPGADGPANLVDALALVQDPMARGRGVLVVMHEEVHAARWISKTRATGARPFESVGGPVARIVMGRADLSLFPESADPMLPGEIRLDATVRVVWAETGGEGSVLRWMRSQGAQAFVLVGTGAGNVPSGYVEAVHEAVAAGLLVVVTSRCQGQTAPIYGGPGGHATLHEHGVLDGRGLSPAKARVALMAALGSGMDRTEVEAWLAKL